MIGGHGGRGAAAGRGGTPHRLAGGGGAVLLLLGVWLACAKPGGPPAEAPPLAAQPDAGTVAYGETGLAETSPAASSRETPESVDAERPERAAERSAEFYYLVARRHELEGREEPALRFYRRALELDPESPLLHYKLAQLALQQGQLEHSRDAAQRAYDLDPETPRFRNLLGTIHRMQGETEDAEDVLTDEAGQPLNFDAGLLLFGSYLDRGDHEAAQRVAEWLVAEDDENLRGHFALAQVLLRTERPGEAETALQRALESHPGSVSVYRFLARIRRSRDDREGEIQFLEEALRAHPGHHRLLAELADAQIALDRRDDARRTLREIETHHPKDLGATARLCVLEYQDERYDEARGCFERVLESDRNRFEASYALGLVHKIQENIQAARAAFAAIPEEHPRFADARSQLAALYEAEGDFAGALRELEAARAAAPSLERDFLVAHLMSRSGDLAGGAALLETLREADPDNMEILYNLGSLYGAARDMERALVYMQQVLERDPDHADALNYIGYTWAEQGVHLDQAEAMIQRALAQRPKDGYITDSLGWVYYMRARPLLEAGEVQHGRSWLVRAVAELERARRLTGGDPLISEHLGDVYFLLDQRERALEFYEEAVESKPDPRDEPALREKLERLRREIDAP